MTKKMAKIQKQEHKSPEEVAGEMEQVKEEGINKRTAEQIENILKENERGLQPFLSITENGIIPRVRLVRMAPQPEVNNNEENKED